MNIEENKQLKFERSLYFRKKLQPQEMKIEIDNIIHFMKENGINQNGSVASSTLKAEQTVTGYLLDTEIIYPIDKRFQSNEKYRYVENISINNALYLRYEGQPNLLQNAYTELVAYIRQHSLTAATAAYNVVVKEPMPNDPICIMDVYIGMQ